MSNCPICETPLPTVRHKFCGLKCKKQYYAIQNGNTNNVYSAEDLLSAKIKKAIAIYNKAVPKSIRKQHAR